MRLRSVCVTIFSACLHWLTLYTFSRQDQPLNAVIDRGLTVSAIVLICAAIVVSQIAIKTLGKFSELKSRCWKNGSVRNISLIVSRLSVYFHTFISVQPHNIALNRNGALSFLLGCKGCFVRLA